MGAAKDDTHSAAWLLNATQGGRNVQSKLDDGQSLSTESSSHHVVHITSFRKPLNELLPPTPPQSMGGPRSPPTLAKLADAVERSIHSPTSMLGYIVAPPPSNQPNQQTNHVHNDKSLLKVDGGEEDDNPSSPHRELSLMKLADAVHMKLGDRAETSLAEALNQRTPLPSQSPQGTTVNHTHVNSSTVNVDLERQYLNIEPSTPTISTSS